MVIRDTVLSRAAFFIGWLIFLAGGRLVRDLTSDAYYPEFVEVGRQICEGLGEKEIEVSRFRDVDDCAEQVSQNI